MDAVELRKYCLLGQNDEIALRNVRDILEVMPLEKSDKLLEIGCGTGGLSKHLSGYVKSITAFDVSPAMIQEAREHFPGNNIEYHVADAGDPSTYKKYGAFFDKVIAHYCLHWLKDPSACLQGIYHCLKPGGRCFVNMQCEVAEDTFSGIFAYPMNSKWAEYMEGYECPYNAFKGTKDDFRKLLDEAGFKSQYVHCKTYIEDLDLDETTAKAYCRTLMGAKNRVPRDKQEEYMNEAFESATKRKTEEGRCILTSKLLAATAQK
ncbi:uncharacterized protein [Ptychodera flava]|uniref:uncharacterized protein n=1 Tax=Ptychodera flava TaxID=63121 RepID=UPI00396AAAEA